MAETGQLTSVQLAEAPGAKRQRLGAALCQPLLRYIRCFECCGQLSPLQNPHNPIIEVCCGTVRAVSCGMRAANKAPEVALLNMRHAR